MIKASLLIVVGVLAVSLAGERIAWAEVRSRNEPSARVRGDGASAQAADRSEASAQERDGRAASAPAWDDGEPSAPVRDDSELSEEALIERGLELRRERRDAEALALFQRAYERSRSPRALAQVALARQALGRWFEAERALMEALAAEDDPWIASRADLLRSALASIREHLAYLVVESSVTPSTLFVDGVRIGE